MALSIFSYPHYSTCIQKEKTQQIELKTQMVSKRLFIALLLYLLHKITVVVMVLHLLLTVSQSVLLHYQLLPSYKEK